MSPSQPPSPWLLTGHAAWVSKNAIGRGPHQKEIVASFRITHSQAQVIGKAFRPALPKLGASGPGNGGKGIPDRILYADAARRQGRAQHVQVIGRSSRIGNVLEAVKQVVKNEVVRAWRDFF